MQLNITLLLAAAVALAGSFTNAAPTPGETEIIPDMANNNGTTTEIESEARDIVLVGQAGIAWNDYNFKGQEWGLTDIGGFSTCHDPYSGNDRFESIEVWKNFECRFYRNRYCLKNLPFGEGGELKRVGPWKGNVPSDWKNKISSYKCDYRP